MSSRVSNTTPVPAATSTMTQKTMGQKNHLIPKKKCTAIEKDQQHLFDSAQLCGKERKQIKQIIDDE